MRNIQIYGVNSTQYGRRTSGELLIDSNISESLQELLKLRPYEINVKNELILTTTPTLWNLENLGNYTKVINLSKLLRVSSDWTSFSHQPISLELEIVEQFIEVGWSNEAVYLQYRHNLKSRFVVDIALLKPDKSLQVAVEVKRSVNALNASTRQVLIDRAREATAAWLCITDKDQFQLINLETEESQLLNHPPKPEEVGVTEWSSNSKKLSNQLSLIQNPSSLEEILAKIAQHQPESLIVDFTLPWGVPVDRELLHNTISNARNLLSDSFQELITTRRQLEILPLVLAWAATLPSVKTLSVIVPVTTTTSESNRWLRDCLTQRLRLCSVVELPSDTFRPVTSITTSILHFGGERDQVYFDILSSRGDLSNINSHPWFDSLSKWMKGKTPSTGYIARVENNNTWAVRANDPEIEKTLERLGRLGELVALDELCEIRRGEVIDSRIEFTEDGIPLVRLSNLRGGDLNLEDVRRVRKDAIPEQAILKAGDFLVPEMITDQFSVVLNRSSEPLAFYHHILVLRLKDNRVSTEYLLEYLNSSTVRKLIAAKAFSGNIGFQRISRKQLGELSVPIFDPALFQGLGNIQKIESDLRKKADELESFRRSLFDAQNIHNLQNSLSELKRRGNILSTSLQSANRLEFQIANFYPFPIAYGFRLLASIVTPSALYKEQLRIAENILAFIGSVSLALLQEQDRLLSRIDPKEYWQGGISPGDWKDITARCSKVFTTYQDHPLAASIEQLNIGSERKGFGRDIAALIRAKNDFKHDRGPNVETEIIKAVEETQETLKRCMESLAFFTEYPIRQILDIDFPYGKTTVNLICLRYTGDHPGLPQEDISLPRETVLRADLRKGDLFLDTGTLGWIPLYPFISSMSCPACKARETYSIDKWDKQRGTAEIKSFERGHSDTNSEIAEALITWTTEGGNPASSEL